MNNIRFARDCNLQALIHVLERVLDKRSLLESADKVVSISVDISSFNALSCETDEPLKYIHFKSTAGLCDNVLYDLLAGSIIPELFISWDGYSGDDFYPVEGEGHAYIQDAKANILYRNLKRWALIEHILGQVSIELSNRLDLKRKVNQNIQKDMDYE